jgi:hypothetical protein
MKKIILQSTCAFLLAGALLTACKKEQSIATDSSNQPISQAQVARTTEATIAARSAFNDVLKNTLQLNVFSPGAGFRSGAREGRDSIGAKKCFEVLYDNVDSVTKRPKKVTVDYKDGSCRTGFKGKIEYTFDYQGDSAYKTTVTFIDFFVRDSIKIEGKTTLERIGKFLDSVLTCKETIENGKITFPNGNFTALSGSKTVIQNRPMGRFNPDGDFRSTDVSYEGSCKYDSVEHKWSVKSIEPLVAKFSCPWIVKGKEEYITNGKKAVVDYGNGDCDFKATLTTDSTTKEIRIF